MLPLYFSQSYKSGTHTLLQDLKGNRGAKKCWGGPQLQYSWDRNSCYLNAKCYCFLEMSLLQNGTLNMEINHLACKSFELRI